MNVRGVFGNSYTLGGQIASGGEGTIYDVPGKPGIVAKMFKPGSADAEKEEKIKAMINMARDNTSLRYTSWPQDILYANGKFAGFTMGRIPSTRKINEIYDTTSDVYYSWKSKISIAYNLCLAVEVIHGIGQVVGDMNPNNICVDTTTGTVYLIDTDSFHITANGKTFRCSVGMSQYLPKSIQEKIRNGNSLRTVTLPTFTKESDNFALAIHIFQLLMNGCHPFTMRKLDVMDSTCLPSQEENIMNGTTAFFKQNTGFGIPVFSPKIDSLPQYITKLFRRAFVDSYDKGLKTCPAANDWKYALRTLLSELKKCQHKEGHMFFKGSANCPWCTIESNLAQFKNPSPIVPPKRNQNNIGANAKGHFSLPNFANMTRCSATKQLTENMFELDGLYFNANRDHAELMRYSGDKDAVMIPGKIRCAAYGLLEVTVIGDHAFANCDKVKRITVPDTVTEIQNSAFMRCSSLTDINIPPSVKKIGDCAFMMCTSIVDFTMPGNVEDVADELFMFCPKLETVNLEMGVKTIGKGSFRSCQKLRSVQMSNTMRKIGDYAFQGCGELGDITLNDSITKVGEYAFLNCMKLKNIKLSKAMTEISRGTFERCGFDSVDIPANIATVREYAFAQCLGLEKVSAYFTLNTVESNAFALCDMLNDIRISVRTKLRKDAFPRGKKMVRV